MIWEKIGFIQIPKFHAKPLLNIQAYHLIQMLTDIIVYSYMYEKSLNVYDMF